MGGESIFERWVTEGGYKKYDNATVFSEPQRKKIKKNTLLESLENPSGTKSLGEVIRGKKINKALILVDDMSRPTPQKEILPTILEIFLNEGIGKEKITILICTGMHRPMSDAEISARFGAPIAASYRIVNHDGFDEANLYDTGITTYDGVPIKLNRLAAESDFILCVGQISPHRVVGFSGGSKMIMPGISGKDAISSIHWLGWTMDSEKIYARINNPARDQITRIGDMLGVDFIVNVIMEDDGVLRYYSGDRNIAYDKACQDILSNYSVEVPEADIVVVDAAPYDLDIWQAAKAVTVAELVVRKGGTVILVASCPDGWTIHRPMITATGYLPIGEIVKKVEKENFDKLTGCHFMAFGRVLDGGKIVVVSDHLKKRDVEEVNLSYAESIDEAISEELSRMGGTASIAILRHACKLIPKKIKREAL